MPSPDERLALAFAHIDQQVAELTKKLDKQQTTLDQIKRKLEEIQREGLPHGR